MSCCGAASSAGWRPGARCRPGSGWPRSRWASPTDTTTWLSTTTPMGRSPRSRRSFIVPAGGAMSPLEPVEVPAVLRGLRIAVLVSGGIAAYKVADLVSRLVQEGCQVRVGMTTSATRFVGAATFRGVSGKPVELDLWTGSHPEPHVELGDW